MSEIAISVIVTNNEKTGLKQWENECFHNVIVGGKKWALLWKQAQDWYFSMLNCPTDHSALVHSIKTITARIIPFLLPLQPTKLHWQLCLPSSLSGMDQTFRAKCSQCLQNWVFVLDFTLSFSPIVLSVHQFGMKTSAQRHIKYYLTASSDHLL